MKQAILPWMVLTVSLVLLVAIPGQAANHAAMLSPHEPIGQLTPSPYNSELTSRSGNVSSQHHDATGSISSSTLPMATPSAVVSVTLANTQSSSTSSQLQQMILFSPETYATYENSNLGNIRFCTDEACSNEMFAWLESCSPSCSSSAASAVAWVLLPSAIAANGGSLTIYMAFMATSIGFDGVYWGEAPELSATYGQYDNGVSVFPSLYANFVGTSLPAGWVSNTAGTGLVSEDNGLTVTTGGGTYSGSVVLSNVATTSSAVANGVVEGYVSAFSNGGNSHIMAIVASTNDNFGTIPTGWGLQGYQPDQIGWQNEVDSGDLLIENNDGGTPSVVASSSSNPSPPLVIGVHDNTLYANYGVGATIASNILGSGYIAVDAGSGTTVPSITYDWMRVRAYPPNGVMPTATLGSVTAGGSPKSTVTIIPSSNPPASPCIYGTPTEQQESEALSLGVISTDLWGIGSTGSGQASMCYSSSTGALTNNIDLTSVSQTGGVDGYPNINYGQWIQGGSTPTQMGAGLVLPTQFSSLPPLWGTSSYSVSNPNDVSSDYAYDIWLTPCKPGWSIPVSGQSCQQSSSAQPYIEVMIWFDWNICPSGGGLLCQPQTTVQTNEYVDGTAVGPFSASLFVYCNGDSGATLSYRVGDDGSTVNSAAISVDLGYLVGTTFGYAASCPVYSGGTWNGESLGGFYLDQIAIGSEFIGSSPSYQWTQTSFCLVVGIADPTSAQLSCQAGGGVSAQAMIGPFTPVQAAAVGGGAAVVAVIAGAVWKGWLPIRRLKP